MKTLIRGGRLINPATNTDEICDVLFENDIITEVGRDLAFDVDRVIDATGFWVVPGLIDVHCHLREPGFEYKETIATGTRSAALGGFTTICAMPNTEPVCDNEIIVEYIKMKAEREGVVNVLPIGAVTKGQKGEELANIGQMAKSGACAISEDGKSVLNAKTLKTAMTYTKMFGLPMFSHCEDKTLTGEGSMNAGRPAERLGLRGIPSDSEEVMVARDIILARSAKAKLHICHVSTKESVDMIRQARAKGLDITAEATPHHFSLADEDITEYNANFKMMPPLRSKEDVEAVRQGLKDGTISIIATDHAPHAIDEKNCEFEKAAFGIVGFETALALGINELVDGGYLTLKELIEKMTINPARLINLDKGTIEPGKAADITIISPKQYTIDTMTFKSKSKNSPFNGKRVVGKVEYTIVGGKIVVEKGSLVEA